MEKAMFCRQCEQAAQGVGCEVMGNCGKNPQVAALLDLMIHGLEGVAVYAHRARELGVKDPEVDRFMLDGLFTRVTNVNFDPEDIAGRLRRCYQMKDQARSLFEKAYQERKGEKAPEFHSGPEAWQPAEDTAGLITQGRQYGVLTWHQDPDTLSALELVLYGLLGMGAFAWHAAELGKEDDEIYAFIHRALAAAADRRITLQDFVSLALECGKMNLRTMELLYQGHAERLADPEPMKVNLGTRGGKGIVVSGHDLPMLEEILKQSEGKGVNVYTHGEMLPANGYPRLRKYAHFAGHFGTAWQNQTRELPDFPGAIIFNTNCIQRPDPSYTDRLFTWGEVAWPGITHLEGFDFSPVIEKAMQLPDLPEKPGQEILVGFGHEAVFKVAGAVVDAVKTGAIRRFFLIGGCDGAKPGRNYFTELAQQVPKDCVILTLACGKNRFNRLEFGDIGGIPRLLDVGQCNDAYSAIRIALALAEAFECGVNELPLSMILSWYEQKAHVILLTLLHLGIKGIRLGPSLPAYVSPGVLDFLVQNYDLGPTTTAENDLRQALGA
ncbi:iron-sulfur-oxygen hybrid cluster protein (prismane) [Geotalea daltonii FRC-32]|uniref:Hydroxylamine reductase n=1 Tax=Geotalea daltonii (strain DSM 22248 / JCM 15807 / FRC-32) TaxID=316067 RepID=B9M9C1_GEODF|nr:hydroxylamine reductase [Geotalea daltonii]ACM18679.1 iron-sulfur-oxygen hybrid cluster protein (prismane) [Geotalea daltonii FRC-32]